MEKEDILLRVELERLEIEPAKVNKTRGLGNPFTNDFKRLNKGHISSMNINQKETRCACNTHKKNKSSGIIKKKLYKILKEPTLKFLKTYGNVNPVEVEECQKPMSKSGSGDEKFDPLNLCTLVRNCNQLKISPSTNDPKSMGVNSNNSNRWWKHGTLHTQEYKEPRQQNTQPGSCSQQALNPPCDVTIDELASYFETLVHIPKKMSSMAEMMYI